MSPSQIQAKADDAEVVLKVVNGNVEAYAELVRRYNNYLYKIGKSYGFRHSEIEDLMQDAYIQAYIHLKDFKHESSFKTWLVRIMLNECYHKVHKSGYKNEVFSEPELKNHGELMFANKDNQTAKVVQNHELKEILEKAIYKIPENYRIVFTLRELNGMSVKETSEILHISESNVKVRFNRAKGMLQSEIKKSYSTREIFEFNLIHCEPLVERVMESIRRL